MKLKKTMLIGGVAGLFALAACTASGDEVSVGPTYSHGNAGKVSSAGEKKQSSSSSAKENPSVDEDLYNMFQWVQIPAMSLTRGVTKFSVNKFSIAATEVTQEAYKRAMGEMPSQPYSGDKYPVVNVSWFEAVLFCNAFSKKVGLDTAYVYKSVGRNSFLDGLEINYEAEAIRLPTEMEWEVAAHGGTSTTYYWNVDEASDYAYYGQSKGPFKVAQKKPNEYYLYDMAGNAAEWVNDWYATLPVNDVKNYVGPNSGDNRCVRGGSWADKVKQIAPDERDKKAPSYSGALVGFRLVYSAGF